MLTKTYLYISCIIFGAVTLGALLSRSLGWYNDYWYTDVILHTLSGIALGFLWVAANHKNRDSSWFVFGIGVVSFATFGSVLWEFWEFAGWMITPSRTQFYLGTLNDTLLDIFCGAIGGLLSAFSFLAIRSSAKKQNQ
jgi:hypothetical protein